jgi:hypothetical protein
MENTMATRNHATEYKGLKKEPPRDGHVLVGEPSKNRLKRVKPKAKPV